MAIECWIWGNANQENRDLQEYQIRLCGDGLRTAERKDRMIELSNRLLAVTKRRESLRTQSCWFAGRLDEEVYLAALAGEQNTLLGTNLVGGRGLYCVLAYGFTGADIRLYRRDEGLFAPLKQRMRDINAAGGRPSGVLDGAALAEICETYAEEGSELPADTGGYNIVKSTPETDERLWRQSLSRPAGIGILSVEDAQRLLNDFPDGLVSVPEDVSLRYLPKIRKTEGQLRKEREVNETLQWARQERENREQKKREAALQKEMEQKKERPKVPTPERDIKKNAKRIADFIGCLPELDDQIERALTQYAEVYEARKGRPLKVEYRQIIKEFCVLYSCRYGYFSKELLKEAYTQLILRDDSY